MTVIAAKPTLYRGIRFRSRLEARWAVFFDSVGIPNWVYEPVIEDAPPGYMPDFDLVVACVEIKPWSWKDDPRTEDVERWKEFAVQTKRDLLAVIGSPGRWENGKLVTFGHMARIFEGRTGTDHAAGFVECAICGTVSIAGPGEVSCGCWQVGKRLRDGLYAVRDFSYEDAP